MFDTINGLPLHPLVVHGVVVLLPLAILGTIAIAVRPRWRTRYGFLVVASALVATILVPISTSSGEALEKRVGDPGEHAELGDQLLWFALVLLIAVTALVVLQWRKERAQTSTEVHRGALNTMTITAVVGDSGGRAAWGDATAAPAPR